MSHNTIASSAPRHEADAHERTLASVANQEAEHDLRRQRLFMEESQTSAAIHADKFSGNASMYAVLAVREFESAHRSANEATGEAALAHADHSGKHEYVHAGPQAGVGGQRTAERLTGATIPFAASSALARPFPTASVMIEGLGQAERNSIFAASGDRVSQIVQPQEAAALEVANDPIAQLALARAKAIAARLESFGPADLNPRNGARSSTPLSGTLTPEQVDSPSRRAIDWQDQIRDASQAREHDPDLQVRRILTQKAIAERSDSSDREIASIFGGASESPGQLNIRSGDRSPHSTVDRESGSNSAERPESHMATQSPADEAVAMAAHEIERLRAAVRQTIDELERARGSVRPPLPALPPDRGAYRIS